MTGFEPVSSGIGSDRSDNCATTTARNFDIVTYLFLCFDVVLIFFISFLLHADHHHHHSGKIRSRPGKNFFNDFFYFFIRRSRIMWNSMTIMFVWPHLLAIVRYLSTKKKLLGGGYAHFSLSRNAPVWNIPTSKIHGTQVSKNLSWWAIIPIPFLVGTAIQ